MASPSPQKEAQKAFSKKLKERRADLKAQRENNLFSYQIGVYHQDGSTFLLNWASAQEKGNFLLVFTEHNGCLGFFLEDLQKWTQKKLS
jgi:hypothetical protein